MATILRIRGLRVVIYSNDHPPPHVHVIGSGREAKVRLSEHEHPSLMTNEGLTRRQLATALAEIERNRELLLKRWKEIHGDL